MFRKQSARSTGLTAPCAVSGLFLLAGPVAAQNCGPTIVGVCTIAPGSYAQPFQYAQPGTPALTFTNNGTFQVTTPENAPFLGVLSGSSQGIPGVDSTHGNAGNGGAAGTLTFTNNGVINQLFAATPNGVIISVRGASQGGRGGDFTDSANADAGNAGAGGSATAVNNAAISITGIGSERFHSGAGLLLESLGGAGGNVAPSGTDHDDLNPTYGSHTGRAGAAGGYAWLQNYAAVSVDLRTTFNTAGYWGIGVRSLGGAGGNGATGQAGGSATQGTYLTNWSSVSLSLVFGGNTPGAGAASLSGAYAVHARAAGGDGSNSARSEHDGGAGGAAGLTELTVGVPGGPRRVEITLATDVARGTPVTAPLSAAIGAVAQGGAGGASYDSSTGGAGGAAGRAWATLLDGVVVRASGDFTQAVQALSQGGAGGITGLGQNNARGGAGGSSTQTGLADPAARILVTNADVRTTGGASAALVASSLGGAGGIGRDYDRALDPDARGGHGGAGGAGGAVLVDVEGGSVSTLGATSAAILALSQGGGGGRGGDATGTGGSSGSGGGGGQAGPVQVTLGAGTRLATSGATDSGGTSPGYGVSAASIGGAGALGGGLFTDFTGRRGDGGFGGHAGDVSVTTAAGSAITTAGQGATALLARSLGGAGGSANTNDTAGFGSDGGSGGSGGNAGNVSVSNAAALTTQGFGAHGIAALSASGISGNGGGGSGVIYGPGGAAGHTGIAGTVSVTNSGAITTAGSAAFGIQAQSIGGGSGSGGRSSGSIVSIGGSAATGGAGGQVSVSQAGGIATSGLGALGLLAQSIGGGGGSAGDASGIFGALGGTGGAGGAGGSATITLAGGTIATTGRLAQGALVQSIGGGGGHGGDTAANGAQISLAIGGRAGGGGAGGPVVVNATAGRIQTAGSNAGGILAQSVGGGGGAAGAAYSETSGALFTMGSAIGGIGGEGGSGGAVTLNLSGLAISTGEATRPGVVANPVDAHGVHAQSIGGGGGVGGGASAEALTIAGPGLGGITLAFALGGAGGTPGHGGAIDAAFGGGATVLTQGQGGHGVLLQSIGGGGGAGGDSSAMASSHAAGGGQAPSVAGVYGVALGGTAGGGGRGGNITALIGRSDITTLGDYAYGVLAQSIGGGGGNAGIGSSATEAKGAALDLQLNIGLGGRGGGGGAGGSVTVQLAAEASIITFGASAHALVAQSIGGGGGVGAGSTVSLNGSKDVEGSSITPGGSVSVALGATGGSGGAGGSISSAVAGPIQSWGSDSPAVVLQSIGGGGGIGGSAGDEASADNPLTLSQLGVDVLRTVAQRNLPVTLALSVALGGRGGVAGDGGAVSHVQSGVIVTRGDWSHGVLAQSIGGGGGLGGVAVSEASEFGASAQLALGGSGGAGGHGGAVSLTFNAGARITTGTAASGYAAFGVLAQSIGGGGGAAADGSTQSILNLTLGAQGARRGGGGSNGGSVTLSGPVRITTNGDVGVAVALQSIGGGGGLGGGGTAISTGFGRFSGQTSLQLGGQGGAAGGGGTVAINQAALALRTAGAHAFGVLAQSIGGGGGFGFAPDLATSTFNAVGAQVSGNPSVGDGGPVTLSLVGGGIETSGFGAHGLVVQSIGGGGGIAGLPNGADSTLVVSLGNTLFAAAPSGSGGDVTITSSTPIVTRGDFAHGIVAQSIGGGGGIVVQGAQVFAGTTNNGIGNPQGVSGQVLVTQSAPITVSGANAIGIFAQGRAPQRGGDGPGQVRVIADAPIQGGGGPHGVGIWADSNGTLSEVQVTARGSVSALSGQAILMPARGTNNILYNYGTITGRIDIGNGFFYNGGTHNAGASLVAGQTRNEGLFVIGQHARHATTRVSGNFTQTATGRMFFDTDFAARQADRLSVAGAADLAGSVRPAISSVLPGVEIPFLEVAGPISGGLSGERSALFDYTVNRKDSTYAVSASANFTPAGFELGRNTAAVANHLQAAWDLGGGPFGALFATLGNIADAGGPAAHDAALAQLVPGAGLAPASRIAAGARSFANAAMSCPFFEGTTQMLREGECVWATLTGRTTAQARSEGLSSFQLDATTWQMGGQRALGGGWFLGGSLAYEEARLSSGDGLSRGQSEAGYGALTAKYQTGAWLFSGALFGGVGQFDSQRYVTLPGFQAVARGSPSLANAGGLLRAAYTLGQEDFYLRPMVSLGAVHARSGAYRESGAGLLNLDMAEASNTVAALTPAIEIGGRVALEHGMVARVFANLGVSFLSDGGWRQEGRLVAAPAGTGSFTNTVHTDRAVGRFATGVQLFASERLEFRLQYDAEVSDHVTGHGGSLSFALRF